MYKHREPSSSSSPIRFTAVLHSSPSAPHQKLRHAKPPPSPSHSGSVTDSIFFFLCHLRAVVDEIKSPPLSFFFISAIPSSHRISKTNRADLVFCSISDQALFVHLHRNRRALTVDELRFSTATLSASSHHLSLSVVVPSSTISQIATVPSSSSDSTPPTAPSSPANPVHHLQSRVSTQLLLRLQQHHQPPRLLVLPPPLISSDPPLFQFQIAKLHPPRSDPPSPSSSSLLCRRSLFHSPSRLHLCRSSRLCSNKSRRRRRIKAPSEPPFLLLFSTKILSAVLLQFQRQIHSRRPSLRQKLRRNRESPASDQRPNCEIQTRHPTRIR